MLLNYIKLINNNIFISLIFLKKIMTTYGTEPLFDKRTNDEFKTLNTSDRHGFILRVYTILMFMLTTTVVICAVFYYK